MSDTTATPPSVFNPLGELHPSIEALEFVNQGIVRFHFPPAADQPEGAERIVRLRRPFLGELKQIRLALADVQADLADVAMSVTAEATTLRSDAEKLAAQVEAEEIDPETHAEGIAEIRRRDRAGARRMDEAREHGTLDWWALVFKTLALDPVPEQDEYPPWILDARLPNTILNHWRLVPAGPG